MSEVAFIGLGNMGGPMAANLVKAGSAVRGFDLSPVACEAATKAGVNMAASARDAVAGAEVVVTMLPAGRHVLAAYADFLSCVINGALPIDTSTIDVDSARKAHEVGAAAGAMTLDAPVSGGVGGASAATLSFMAGGSDEAFAKAKPILEAMGKRIVHCGGAGAGQAAKICNNMILGATMIVTCEAFALGEKLGLSSQALYDVASTSSGQSWSLTSYCPVPGPVPTSPANRDYKPGFAAALMLKDLRLAQEVAASTGASMRLGQRAAEIYEAFAAAGRGGEDFSAVILALREGGAYRER
jgi:3-hydroxyisobutyrate dehydrogenase